MKRYSPLIIISSALFIVLILLLIPSTNYSKETKINNNLYDSFKSIAINMNSEYSLVNEVKLSNKITHLVYKSDATGEYKTYFINNKTGYLVNYYALIKHGYEEEFDKVEAELLQLKYPDFIVNGIYNSGTEREIEVFPNCLVIHYNNVITSPKYNDEIFLVINNHDISKYLSYEFTLDEEYERESAYTYDPTKKYIAFTFDDGPSQANTLDIVNYLKANKASATFFMLGKLMNNNPSIVNYVKDNGMEIGSHTYSHQNLKRLKATKLDEEVKNTEDVYLSITGDTLSLLRPPYGSINDSIKEKYNYSYILWSVDTLDWKYKDKDYLYDYVINNVNDGDIVLMHDIHQTTKEAVELILPELYVRGYRVVSVSELAKIKNVELEEHKGYRKFVQ